MDTLFLHRFAVFILALQWRVRDSAAKERGLNKSQTNSGDGVLEIIITGLGGQDPLYI